MADFFTIEDEYKKIYPKATIIKTLDDSCISKIEFGKSYDESLFYDYCHIEYNAVLITINDNLPVKVAINSHRQICPFADVVKALSDVKKFYTAKE